MYLPINSSYKDTAEHKHIYWNSHLTYMYVQTCCNALRSTLTWTMTGNNAKHAPKRRKRERSRNDIRGKNKSKIMKKKQTSADCSPTDLATWQQPDCLILNAEYTRPLDHSATLAWTFSLWEEGLWRTPSSVTPRGTDSYTSGTDLPGAFENAPWLQGWWTQYILLSEHCGPWTDRLWQIFYIGCWRWTEEWPTAAGFLEGYPLSLPILRRRRKFSPRYTILMMHAALHSKQFIYHRSTLRPALFGVRLSTDAPFSRKMCCTCQLPTTLVLPA